MRHAFDRMKIQNQTEAEKKEARARARAVAAAPPRGIPASVNTELTSNRREIAALRSKIKSVTNENTGLKRQVVKLEEQIEDMQ